LPCFGWWPWQQRQRRAGCGRRRSPTDGRRGWRPHRPRHVRNPSGTEGGVLAHANGSAPRGSDRVVLCADQSIDDFGTDDLGGTDAVAKCGGGVCDLLEDGGLRKPATICVGSYARGLGEGYNAYGPGASPSQLAPFGLSPLTPIGPHPSTLLGLADLGLCASRAGHGRLRGLGPLQQRRRRCPASDRRRRRSGHDRR
jgi:hypothetical protein